jgi:hypothetical protein
MATSRGCWCAAWPQEVTPARSEPPGRARRQGRIEVLKCGLCGDVIGEDEPLVVVDEEDGARRTSLTAEPQLSHGRHVYHDACHAAALARHDDTPAGDQR